MTTLNAPTPLAARAKPKVHLGLFRFSGWDAIPAALTFIQLGLFIAFFVAWPHLNWPARFGCAALYALGIGWNLDSVSHNFIHNPFFAWEPLNRLVRYALTLSLGTPQTMYKYVHMRHHAGNSDRIGADGTTIDPISLYQFGHDNKVEPPISYVLTQFWRDDGPYTVARKIREKRPKEAAEALREFWTLVIVYLIAFAIHWDFVLFLLPFYYIGQSISFLIAWYEHAGADPENPIATGVSTYEPLYNFVFLNNGFHAEHHHRPKHHWSKMSGLREETREAQAAAGVRVLRVAHFLGFVDPATWTIPSAKKLKAARDAKAVNA